MKTNNFNKTCSFQTKTYAKEIANRLGESSFKPFIAISALVPKPIIELALKETELAATSDILHRTIHQAFLDRLKYYAKSFGIKLPKCLRD